MDRAEKLRTYEAITRLNNTSDDFSKFVSLLENMKSVKTESLIRSNEDVEVRRIQGELMMLQDIFKTISDAPKIVEKLRKDT